MARNDKMKSAAKAAQTSDCISAAFGDIRLETNQAPFAG
jgi:hypothetical protein